MSDGSKTESIRERSTLVLRDGDEARERARTVVQSGGVLAFRTDTFYGLGASPFDAAAVDAINELKGREGKPILVVVSDADVVNKLVANRSRLFNLLAEKFRAGALTLVVPARTGLPKELTAGTATVGVRLPVDEEVRAFIRACGGALTATSANRAGGPPAKSADEVLRAFPAGLDLIVDAGASRAVEPSTVVDVSGNAARLIREGVIPWREIEKAIEELK
ncbi:MAG: L-threonylcarbamoyladenylate synthase [Acidobacteriota bacterium]|nr:L-threonylcarbamoyladenylate synthase [Acidobacteriota bacterium]